MNAKDSNGVYDYVNLNELFEKVSKKARIHQVVILEFSTKKTYLVYHSDVKLKQLVFYVSMLSELIFTSKCSNNALLTRKKYSPIAG